MTNKVRGSIIDLPAVGSAPPSSGNYTAGQIILSKLAEEHDYTNSD